MRNFQTSSPVVGALVIVLAFASWTQGQEPFRRTLISVQRNANADPLVAGRDVTLSRYEVPQSPIQWSVKKFRMFGGKQDRGRRRPGRQRQDPNRRHPDAGHGHPHGDPGGTRSWAGIRRSRRWCTPASST